MICKEHAASILVQITTLVNDEWFYHKTTVKDEKNYSNILAGISKIKKGFHLNFTKKKQEEILEDYVLFNEDKQYYSFFSFTMFNYLLYSLKKGNVMLSTPKYRMAMQHLLMYVYDYNNDPFCKSLKLLKKGYLSYYFNSKIESEYVNEAGKIYEDIKTLIRIF